MSSELVNYSTGTTVTANWLNRTQLREEGLPSYVIYQLGSTTYAKALLSGGLDYSGAEPGAVIVNALNTLSAGRTWKERVQLKGSITGLTTNITVPSYSIVDLTGARLQVNNAANLSSGIFTLPANATNVDIFNGLIDGNSANQTLNGAHGILLGNNNSVVKIVGTKIVNIYKAFGTYLPGNLSNVLIQDVSYDTIGGSAIASDTSNGGTNANVRIIRPTITNYAQQSFGGSFDAIHTESANTRWLVDGADIDGTGALQNGHGIVYSTMTEGRIVNSRVYKARLNGINILASTDVKVLGNHADSNGQAASAGYQQGIAIDDAGITPASTRNTVKANTILNNLGFGFTEKGTATGNLLSHNTFNGNGNTVSIAVSSTTKVFGNPGYNPVGLIGTPFDNTANTIGIRGTSATLTSAKTYTCTGTPLDLYLGAGTVTAMTKNGQTIGSGTSILPASTATTALVHLEPGDTWSITFSVTPATQLVFGL